VVVVKLAEEEVAVVVRREVADNLMDDVLAVGVENGILQREQSW
jgi:hypothetical protein